MSLPLAEAGSRCGASSTLPLAEAGSRCGASSTLPLASPWFTAYAALELELDSPILEALGAYYACTLRDAQDLLVAHRAHGFQPHVLCDTVASDIDPGVRLHLVARRGELLQYLPVDQRTPLMCLLAVQANWPSLAHVPQQTPVLIDLALRLCGTAIQYVREPTQEWCLLAITTTAMAVEVLPHQFRTSEFMCRAVQVNGLCIAYVSLVSLQEHPDLCLKAVQQNGLALQHVDKRFRTEEVCIAAVRQNVLALRYTPKSLTFRVHHAAVMSHLHNMAQQRPDLAASLEHITDLVATLDPQ